MRRSFPMLVVAAMVLSSMPGVIASASGAPPTSAAQYKPTNPSARARFEQGNRLVRDARGATRPADKALNLHRAIDEYLAGRAIEDVAAFDYNIAQCARLLVDHATAVIHLQRFLDRAQPAPDAELRQAVERQIAELDPLGTLRTSRPGDRGVEPRDRESAGPAPVPMVAPLASPSATPAMLPAVPAMRGDATTSAAPPDSRAWAVLGWSLTGAGVIGTGATAWLGINASGLDSDSHDASRTISNRLALQDQADSRRRTALIVGIGSGVAIVGGVMTLVLTARTSASGSPRAAWRVGVSGHGVAVSGWF